VNLECPLLAIRRHGIVHLLAFPPYAERLLAQPSAVFCRLIALASA
jgi:hypothetical protein